MDRNEINKALENISNKLEEIYDELWHLRVDKQQKIEFEQSEWDFYLNKERDVYCHVTLDLASYDMYEASHEIYTALLHIKEAIEKNERKIKRLTED